MRGRIQSYPQSPSDWNKVIELDMELLLNVFDYVTGGGYDTPNTTNTVSSSLMSHIIIFLKVTYYMAFFHRKLFPETISGPVILLVRFFRVSPRHYIVSARFSIAIVMVTTTKCYNVGTASRYDAAELQRVKLHIRYRPRKPEHKNEWWIVNTTLFDTRDCTCGTHLNTTHISEALLPPTNNTRSLDSYCMLSKSLCYGLFCPIVCFRFLTKIHLFTPYNVPKTLED